MVYLAKGGSWLAIGQVISIISGLALAVGFANLLPKEVYGNYKFVLSLAAIIGTFSLTGMSTAITQAVARGFDGVFRSGFSVYLKWSVIIFIGGTSGALYYFVNDNSTLALSLLIVGSFVPFLNSFTLYNAFLQGKKDFKKISLYGIFRSTIPAIFLLLTVVATNNPVLIVFVYFASHTTIALFFYFRTVAIYKPEGPTDVTAIQYGKHLSIIRVVYTIANNVDKILIFHFLGAIQLAIYAFALAIPNQVISANNIIKLLILPRFSNRSISELKMAIPGKILRLFIFVTLLTLLYIVTAPYIFQFLFPQYIDSVIYSQVYALVLLYMPTIFIQQLFFAHMKKKQLYTVTAISPISKIILLLLLLPPYGIWGAVIALLLARAIDMIVLIFLFRRVS